MADDLPILPVVTHSLALALVATSDAPILLLDGNLTVVAASDSFARAFQVEPDHLNGESLFALGSGEWDVPQLRSLLKATLSGAANIDTYEMDLKRQGLPSRCLVITAHMLEYGDPGNIRLLLAVSDVTDARLAERLKDDLLREKAILFQELQHRVANSLQIIASVLMQSARRVSSEETKSHLRDAHSRVMSVAALQHQLAASNVSDVELRGYLTELCESIAASMIHDRNRLTLEVVADLGTATPEVSVSLGLVVTELVINSLKHAFPEARGGQIVVGYKAAGRAWTLSVSDDGVGMPRGAAPAKAGLGTSIVQALAKQMGATVEVSSTLPGTNIAIVHTAGLEANPASVLSAAV
ncbi:MAG TPA: histidine kinase dimerization/phosphoacceptor domain -containing protein [Phenylobacterium sp.]|jgi:two-component sensor histidine kinase|nr:histidine kinase dimerization/phosphoacceptor domain -containing protein [Phenylobacterium sp.]